VTYNKQEQFTFPEYLDSTRFVLTIFLVFCVVFFVLFVFVLCFLPLDCLFGFLNLILYTFYNILTCSGDDSHLFLSSDDFGFPLFLTIYYISKRLTILTIFPKIARNTVTVVLIFAEGADSTVSAGWMNYYMHLKVNNFTAITVY